MHQRNPRPRILVVLFVFALVFPASRLPAIELRPYAPGEFAVGSSNMEVPDKPNQPMIDYLKGTPGEKGVYITELFLHPETALHTTVQIPSQPRAYGGQSGKTLPLAFYVLYPTCADNTREDYKFPYSETGDNVFPHMQRKGDKPIFPQAGQCYPLIVYSHGYDAHGLWDLHHLKVLAAHGYIVVCIFHGDARSTFFENFGLRPLEFQRAIDYLLAHPDFGPAIDRDRIGASGSSFGGYTILSVMGGKYLRSVECEADARIKAGFGLVPFVGGDFSNPFGKDYSGLKPVKIPFFAVYGEKDTNVRPETIVGAFSQLNCNATAIMLDGEKHILSGKVWSDVLTWELLFFDAWLRGNPDAKRQLMEGTSVQGGVDDHRTMQKLGNSPAR
jgi:hypothetical protein